MWGRLRDGSCASEGRGTVLRGTVLRAKPPVLPRPMRPYESLACTSCSSFRSSFLTYAGVARSRPASTSFIAFTLNKPSSSPHDNEAVTNAHHHYVYIPERLLRSRTHSPLSRSLSLARARSLSFACSLKTYMNRNFDEWYPKTPLSLSLSLSLSL